MALPVMSPLVSERIWALPVGPASVKFLMYLVYRSDDSGALPSQRQMATEYKVSRSTVSSLLDPLFEMHIVMRTRGSGGRGGNSYRLHPLAMKYPDAEVMEAAFRRALDDMRADRLPTLVMPQYQAVPPAEGAGGLKVA